MEYKNNFKYWATFISLLFLLCNIPVFALIEDSFISSDATEGSFCIASEGAVSDIYYSNDDYTGVAYAVKDLKSDIHKVTGIAPSIIEEFTSSADNVIIIGTLGRNAIIDKLVNEKLIDVSGIKDHWESFIIQNINNPLDGVKNALVIVGGDKRGTIFGVYELCQQIGVSPWLWWADVPVRKRNEIFVNKGPHTNGEPAVKYRGIFINDEAPALSGWAQERFGGFNHLFYEHVFELILRLKGNYLWPAMWGSAFYDDDSLNAVLADEYGIIIGTSHHEPLMRAHDEWRRYGSGPWNYDKNSEKLREFWTGGISRMGNKESIITVGMRGDGDEPMTEGTAIALLERIVSDQRKIIAEVTGKDPETFPQDWALYKEVQEYYDNGMRVPEDITLLLCDDNWGNVRRLPKPGDPERRGGYGMYYHFDFVGGPRNYKWLNTNPIARIWEQMNLCYAHGVDRIWIVNVGDIKPMEYPIQFFLDYAWNPEKWTASELPHYAKLWVEEQFGAQFSDQIASFITKYLMYNSRKKPEMLSSQTYSLHNYREYERIVDEYNLLMRQAKEVEARLPAEYKDAYYQLIMHPIEACANLNELYYLTAKNHYYASQGRAATNDIAEMVKKLYNRDQEITNYYNQVMAGGKWNHMMDQTHIGYTSWQQPDKNSMPEVKQISISKKANVNISLEGSEKSWPDEKSPAALPTFDRFNQQEYFIEIFNKGISPFEFEIVPAQTWIKISAMKGKIEKEARIFVSIDWDNVPEGDQSSSITINSGKFSVDVLVKVKDLAKITVTEPAFMENNGYIAIEAEHFSKATNNANIYWQTVPWMGRTFSGVTSLPGNHGKINVGEGSPNLEYPIYLINTGKVKVDVYISPSLNFYNDEGLKYGISIDNEPIQIISIHKNDTIADWKYPPVWNNSVADNIRILSSEHMIGTHGMHVIKLWLVTPGVVFQKIVLDAGGLKPSYLGPPESILLTKE